MNAPRSERRGGSDLGFVFALLLVALLPRLFVAIAWSREPVWDGHYYHFGAERIAAGLGYSEDAWVHGHLVWKPWVHYPVGYSAILGVVYRLFGAGLLVAPLINAITGALLALFTYRFALYFMSRTRARVAGGLVALHPGLIAYSALVMTEIVAALLVVAVGLCLMAYRGRPRGWLISGLLLGASTLLRPTSLLVLPFLGLTQSRRFLPWLRSSAIIIAVSMLVVLPWTARNCRLFDGCALVSTNGGWNLAIGAISDTGRFQTLRASDGCAVVTGQVQQDRCWAQLGKRKILSNPLRFVGLVPKKLAETFNHESFAFEYLHEADPISWPEPRRAAGRELGSTFHRLLVILAALGVVALPRSYSRDRSAFCVQVSLLAIVGVLAGRAFANDQHPVHWLVLFIAAVGFLPLPGRPRLGSAGIYVIGFIVCVIVTHALFFGEDRYHIVVSPLLCLLAAGALRPPRSAVEPRTESPRLEGTAGTEGLRAANA